MDLFPHILQFVKIAIAFGPNFNSLLEIVQMAIATKQTNHAWDIVGMITALQEARRSHVEMRLTFFKFKAGLVVAQRNSKRREVSLEVSLVMRPGIMSQMHNSLFLGLGPETLSAHIGAITGQNLHSIITHQKEAG